MKFTRLILSIGLLAITACASPGPYRPAASAGGYGYWQQAVEPDRYRVQFRATGKDIARAQDYALLRAAEVTLERGYATFEVVSRSADAVREAGPVADFPAGPDYAVTRRCGLLGCTSTARPAPPLRTSGPQATRSETLVTLEVQLSNKDASVSPSLYSASQVAASLGRSD